MSKTAPHFYSVPPGVLYAALVGETIRLLRGTLSKRGTQGHVADRLGLTGHSTLARIERGAVVVNAEQLATLADIFSTSPGDILATTDAMREILSRDGVLVLTSRAALAQAVAEGRCDAWRGRIHDLFVRACPDIWGTQGQRGWELESIRNSRATGPANQ